MSPSATPAAFHTGKCLYNVCRSGFVYSLAQMANGQGTMSTRPSWMAICLLETGGHAIGRLHLPVIPQSLHVASQPMLECLNGTIWHTLQETDDGLWCFLGKGATRATLVVPEQVCAPRTCVARPSCHQRTQRWGMEPRSRVQSLGYGVLVNWRVRRVCANGAGVDPLSRPIPQCLPGRGRGGGGALEGESPGKRP